MAVLQYVGDFAEKAPLGHRIRSLCSPIDSYDAIKALNVPPNFNGFVPTSTSDRLTIKTEGDSINPV